MIVKQIAKDFNTSKEWPYPKLPCVKIWKGFAQQLLRYGQKGKSKQGQGHSLKSSIKVTKFQSALRLLLLNKHKKFENDAIARFCSSIDNSKKWKRNKKQNMATGSIIISTESTFRSIINIGHKYNIDRL